MTKRSAKWTTNRFTSARMARVRRKDTPIEVKLRKAVWSLGGRYRTQLTDLPGRPDFGSRVRRVAVFVDGCFWHGCPTCYRRPAANAVEWKRKVAYNRARRRMVRRQLKSMDWTVFEVWGHQVNGDLGKVALRVAKALQ